MRELSAEEREIIDMLGQVWNKFIKLPNKHPNSQTEFCNMIHQAQNLVAARAVWTLANEG